jgi:hypothetical protein
MQTATALRRVVLNRECCPARARQQAIFLGATEPRAIRPEKFPPRASWACWRCQCSAKNPYIDANLRRAKNPDMTIVEITGGMLRAARSLAGL